MLSEKVKKLKKNLRSARFFFTFLRHPYAGGGPSRTPPLRCGGRALPHPPSCSNNAPRAEVASDFTNFIVLRLVLPPPFIIRRPHKGRCSEPRRAPKYSQGRPLRALGKVELVQRPIGHDHAISGRLVHMCMLAYACPQALWFAGLPVPLPRGTGLQDSRKQDV